jgi:hypothetical protein
MTTLEIKIIKKTDKTITFTDGIAKWTYSISRFNRELERGNYKIV